ncbi:MAG: ribosomal protein S2 [Cenarchaeum symbiont of Oopsacas minuta]|nr:ribosomal protein S2 [Cenarchaeum symbiont of Oopsacas minuta]
MAWQNCRNRMIQQADSLDINKMILTTGIRVGTQVRTKFMRQFTSKTSDDGLYRINLDLTMARIMTAAKFIQRIGISNLIVYSGREHANTSVEKFCDVTGATKMTGRFMPGTLTNPSLPYYIEPKILFVSDPQVDVQAITEATNAGIPVISISNTDNVTSNVDLIIPANNRGRKALATAYWLLARQILIEKGDIGSNDMMELGIDDFETKLSEGVTE